MKDMTSDLRTSAEWYKNLQENYSIQILDYDGWDRDNFDYSFSEEKITSEEFDRRLERSTILAGQSPYITKWEHPFKNIKDESNG